MKCSAVKKNILRWSDGEPSETTLHKEIDGHLAQCESCTLWQQYQKALADGARETEIPPFKMSPRVAQAIHMQAVQATEAKSSVRFVPSFRLSIAVATLGVMFAFVGIYYFMFQDTPEQVGTQWVQVDGQAYNIARLDPSASLDTDYLRPSMGSALQSDVSRQLVFLTEPMISALRSIDEFPDWEALREALEEQAVELPDERPKLLALSRQLTELLQTDALDAEIWIIQPIDSMLLFTTVEDGTW